MTRKDLLAWICFFIVIFAMLILLLLGLKIKDKYLGYQPDFHSPTNISAVYWVSDHNGTDYVLYPDEEHCFNEAGKAYCLRGNYSFSNVLSAYFGSRLTGIDIRYGEPWSPHYDFSQHPEFGLFGLYVEDVGDLSLFWEKTGIFK